MFQKAEPSASTFLVPLDGSRLAEVVLPVVELLDSRLHARVMLLHVLEQRPPATIHGERHLADSAEARTYLDEVAARLRASNVSVEVHVHEARQGDVVRSIVDHAQEVNADLMILCTHGGSGLRKLLFGSIAQKVLQQGGQPILLVPPKAIGSAQPFNLRRILVPLDGTAAHEPALPVASALAQAFKAQMELVVVIPTLATLSDERMAPGLFLPTTMKGILDLAQQGARDYLEQIAAQCRARGVAVTAQVIRGDPIPAVLGLARSLDTDLIVMASHGRAGLEATLSSSVAPRIAGGFDRLLLLVQADEARTDKG